MAEYRLQFSSNGRIRHIRHIECPSDEDAIREAQAEPRNGHDLEVWEGRRLIAALSEPEAIRR